MNCKIPLKYKKIKFCIQNFNQSQKIISALRNKNHKEYIIKFSDFNDYWLLSLKSINYIIKSSFLFFNIYMNKYKDEIIIKCNILLQNDLFIDNILCYKIIKKLKKQGFNNINIDRNLLSQFPYKYGLLKINLNNNYDVKDIFVIINIINLYNNQLFYKFINNINQQRGLEK